MRINFNSAQPKNTIINAARVNASFAKNSRRTGSAAGNGRSDRATFSPQGKLMSMIENLTKQKQAIIERKNELVENTLKNGGKVDDIKDQLKNYGKQLADLDKQIAGLYAQQAKACVEPEDRKKKDRTDPDKTEEQREVERLSSLANVSDGIRNAEKISAVKDRVEGEMHVKEAEVSQGGVHVDALVSKGMGSSAKVTDLIDNEMSSLKRKEIEIAALGERASALGDSQGKSLKDSMDALEENRETDDETVREDKAEESRTGIRAEESQDAKNTGSVRTDPVRVQP
ncbi:MAG: hypothetical protein LUK37_14795 [Clostridia bacterium]|nr:hypothetical protein [Clostridia bacterium]